MVSGWALDGNIVFAPRRRINSQRGHEDLVHSKAKKTEGPGRDELLLVRTCGLGTRQPRCTESDERELLPTVSSVFVAFASLL